MKTYNDDLSRLFNEMADLLALLDENAFKIRAYREAARRLKEDIEPITQKTASRERFLSYSRIGPALADKMLEYIRTRKIAALEALRKQIPKPVRDLLEIPHLGPRRVRELHFNLGIRSRADLIAAAKDGSMAALRGFGPKLVAQVMEALKTGQEKKRRHPRARVAPVARKLKALFASVPGVEQAEVAGSYRRGASTVGDLDILLLARGDVSAAILERIKQAFPACTVLAAGPSKISFVIFPENLQVDVRFTGPESYGAALLYFTGSKDHNVSLRKEAIRQGFLLNEYGLFKAGEYAAGETERSIFKALGLPYVPPAKRV